MFQDTILTTDVPEHSLCSGDVGVVVEHHVVDGLEDGYRVEFFDMTGKLPMTGELVSRSFGIK